MRNLDLLRRVDDYAGSFLIFILRPFAIAAGALLSRDHCLNVGKEIVFFKLLGGGSIVMAYPALLGIRKKFPDTKLLLICSSSVKTYAELLGVFDEFLVVDLANLRTLTTSVFKILKRVFRTDCIVNFEVHSKLATIFALATCARNRIGFYQSWNRWQRGLATHLFFFNTHAATFESYNQIARSLGADIISQGEVCKYFATFNTFSSSPAKFGLTSKSGTVALLPFCSKLGTEREFSASEWCAILRNYAGNNLKKIVILGGPADYDRGEQFSDLLSKNIAGISVENHCGKHTLRDSVELANSVEEIFAIDSGLNHLVRMLEVKLTSFWGPTDPNTRLAPLSASNERFVYKKIFCSPCVHVVHSPPCKGMNLCMQQHLNIDVEPLLALGWEVLHTRKAHEG